MSNKRNHRRPRSRRNRKREENAHFHRAGARGQQQGRRFWKRFRARSLRRNRETSDKVWYPDDFWIRRISGTGRKRFLPNIDEQMLEGEDGAGQPDRGSGD